MAGSMGPWRSIGSMRPCEPWATHAPMDPWTYGPATLDAETVRHNVRHAHVERIPSSADRPRGSSCRGRRRARHRGAGIGAAEAQSLRRPHPRARRVPGRRRARGTRGGDPRLRRRGALRRHADGAVRARARRRRRVVVPEGAAQAKLAHQLGAPRHRAGRARGGRRHPRRGDRRAQQPQSRSRPHGRCGLRGLRRDRARPRLRRLQGPRRHRQVRAHLLQRAGVVPERDEGALFVAAAEVPHGRRSRRHRGHRDVPPRGLEGDARGSG